MIEVKDLCKRYGDHLAVDNLSFIVEEHQIYGFLGPNGAGKSTTMNMMTGYLAPTSGSVTINGIDVMKQPEEAKRYIGYLPELPPLYMDMTVKEYLDFVAELKGLKGNSKKEDVKRVMELTQITHMEKRLIKNLSKGYKQRTGLAQAMLGNPKVIILDEPSVGLDPKQIIEMRELIRSLKEKHTVILSSHIMQEISAVCDKIMIISDGKLVACDTAEGLRKHIKTTLEIDITYKGDFEKASAAISGIEGITVTDNGKNSEGYSKLHISCAENTDPREDIFFALADSRIFILEMVHETKTLEDIFLELTEKADEQKTSPVASDENNGEEK